MSALERWFSPTWAGGWGLTRWLFALAALVAHLPRYQQIQDAQACPDVVQTVGPLALADSILLSEVQSLGLWAVGLVGLAGLLRGGRWAKPGLLVWLVSYYGIIGFGGLSARVPERLFLWVSLGLLLAPIGERQLTLKARSPAVRWYFLVLAASLYGSTGWLKALLEPAWWTGEALAYNLVDRDFGLGRLGVWVSGKTLLTQVLSWTTLAIEASFPLLIWFRKTNPWVLLAALCMHVGIESLMTVGALSVLTLSLFPILLHPDVARGLWERHGRR